MRKTIVAAALIAASVAFGLALAGTVGTPAAAESADANPTTGTFAGFTQVQEESPGPGGERESNGARDHNCPDRDGDGAPDDPGASETSLDQV